MILHVWGVLPLRVGLKGDMYGTRCAYGRLDEGRKENRQKTEVESSARKDRRQMNCTGRNVQDVSC